jgi:hypothetical protein
MPDPECVDRGDVERIDSDRVACRIRGQRDLRDLDGRSRTAGIERMEEQRHVIRRARACAVQGIDLMSEHLRAVDVDVLHEARAQRGVADRGEGQMLRVIHRVAVRRGREDQRYLASGVGGAGVRRRSDMNPAGARIWPVPTLLRRDLSITPVATFDRAHPCRIEVAPTARPA